MTKQQKRYYRLKAEKRCVACGIDVSKTGKTYCQNCIDKVKADKRDCFARGICIICRKNKTDGYVRCDSCREKHNIDSRIRYQSRKRELNEQKAV